MIRGLLEWYWTWVIVTRAHVRKQPRQKWFAGAPSWYVRELASEGTPSWAPDEVKMIARQAREECRGS